MPDKPTTSPTSESETGLIQCPACQGKVSRAAPTCPHCGHPLASPKASPTDDFFARTQKNAADMKKGCAVFLAIGVGLVLLMVLASLCDSPASGVARPIADDVGPYSIVGTNSNSAAGPRYSVDAAIGPELGYAKLRGTVQAVALDAVKEHPDARYVKAFLRLELDGRECGVIALGDLSLDGRNWPDTGSAPRWKVVTPKPECWPLSDEALKAARIGCAFKRANGSYDDAALRRALRKELGISYREWVRRTSCLIGAPEVEWSGD